MKEEIYKEDVEDLIYNLMFYYQTKEKGWLIIDSNGHWKIAFRESERPMYCFDIELSELYHMYDLLHVLGIHDLDNHTAWLLVVRMIRVMVRAYYRKK